MNCCRPRSTAAPRSCCKSAGKARGRSVVSILIAFWFACASPLGAEERLTKDGAVKMDPTFIDEGRAIVFTLEQSPTLWRLMRLTLADGRIENLHADAATNEFEPAFSPDGRYVAFVQNRGNLSLRLVIRDYVEKRDAYFDPGGGFAGMRRPTISADASRVAFSLAGSGGKQIVSCDIDGKNRRDLTQSASLNYWPAYSPDGRQIAFGSSRDGDFDIYVMDADGANVRRVVESPGADSRPAWSPNGKRIAFTSQRNGNAEIYILDIASGDQTRLTTNEEQDDYPAWSPQGNEIAFVGERTGEFDLYLIDAPLESNAAAEPPASTTRP